MKKKASAGISSADQLLSEPEALENLQAASLHPERARFMDSVHRAIDHAE
jgi:hypothetical protein